MYEFQIYNERIDTMDFIFGYSIADAFERNPSLNPDEWSVLGSDYID